MNRRPRKKSIIRSAEAILLLGSAALVFILFEITAFYILDWKAAGYDNEKYYRFSPQTGHAHRPNTEGWFYRYSLGEKFRVSVNGAGFPDVERSLEKKRPRIAFVGDSTSVFWETKPQNRGQFVLEKLLENRFEVINLGVRGFGTDQAYLFYERAGRRFSPDIVIYTLCINDFHDNAHARNKPRFVFDPDNPESLVLKNSPVRFDPSLKNTGFRDPESPWTHVKIFLENHSFVYRRLVKLKRRFLGGTVPLENHFELRPYKKEYNFEDKRRRDLTLRLILELKNLVEHDNARFLLVEGAYRPALDPRLRESLIERYGDVFDFEKVSTIIEDFSREHGIALLSLPREIAARGRDVSRLMHPDDFMHLNGRGIRFLCGLLKEKLESQGWISNPKPGRPSNPPLPGPSRP